MSCSTTESVGPKQYGGTATTTCTWSFTCESPFAGGQVTVTCNGTRTGRLWSQTTTYTTTCVDDEPCAGHTTTTTTTTSTAHGIDWGGCDLGGNGRSCCPDNTLPTWPYYDPSPPPS